MLRRLFTLTDAIDDWWTERDDLLFPWFGRTLAGAIAAGALTTFLSFWEPIDAFAIFALPVAAATLPALAQRRLIRRRFPPLRWWVRASALGGLASISGFLAAVLAIRDAEDGATAHSLLGWLVMWLSFTVIPACAQYLVLRRHVRRAGWWIAAAAVCGLCIGAFSFGGALVPSESTALSSPNTAPATGSAAARRDPRGQLLSRSTGRRVGLISWLFTGAVTGATFGLPLAALSTIAIAIVAPGRATAPGSHSGAAITTPS